MHASDIAHVCCQHLIFFKKLACLDIRQLRYVVITKNQTLYWLIAGGNSAAYSQWGQLSLLTLETAHANDKPSFCPSSGNLSKNVEAHTARLIERAIISITYNC